MNKEDINVENYVALCNRITDLQYEVFNVQSAMPTLTHADMLKRDEVKERYQEHINALVQEREAMREQVVEASMSSARSHAERIGGVLLKESIANFYTGIGCRERRPRFLGAIVSNGGACSWEEGWEYHEYDGTSRLFDKLRRLNVGEYRLVVKPMRQ